MQVTMVHPAVRGARAKPLSPEAARRRREREEAKINKELQLKAARNRKSASDLEERQKEWTGKEYTVKWGKPAHGESRERKRARVEDEMTATLSSMMWAEVDVVMFQLCAGKRHRVDMDRPMTLPLRKQQLLDEYERREPAERNGVEIVEIPRRPTTHRIRAQSECRELAAGDGASKDRHLIRLPPAVQAKKDKMRALHAAAEVGYLRYAKATTLPNVVMTCLSTGATAHPDQRKGRFVTNVATERCRCKFVHKLKAYINETSPATHHLLFAQGHGWIREGITYLMANTTTMCNKCKRKDHSRIRETDLINYLETMPFHTTIVMMCCRYHDNSDNGDAVERMSQLKNVSVIYLVAPGEGYHSGEPFDASKLEIMRAFEEASTPYEALVSLTQPRTKPFPPRDPALTFYVKIGANLIPAK